MRNDGRHRLRLLCTVMDAQQARLTRRKGGLTDLQRMCSANSTVRRTVSGQVVDNMSSAASVVSTDHQPAMDFCQHPELQTAHGFTSRYESMPK